MIRILLTFIVLLWSLSATAQTIPTSLAECTALCNQYFPGGPVIPPVTPVPTTKPYPGKVTFDKTSDQGSGIYYGTACVLLDPGMIKVVLNGEVAFKGNQYKGRDVWRFLKVGDGYAKPWTFQFIHADGTVYSYIVTATADPVVGSNKETSKTSAYANGNREHFRLSKSGVSYGNNITLTFSNGLTRTIKNGETRQEFSDGVLWKPVSDSNSKAVVLGPRNVRIASLTVSY